MKKIIHFVCALSLVLLLISCQNKAYKSPEEFDAFINEVWKEEMSKDYINVVFTFQDPASFGINVENIEVSLGDAFYDEEDLKKERDSMEEILNQLKDYSYDSLNQNQQVIYQFLKFNLEKDLTFYSEDYLYMNHYFNPFSGIHTDLPTLFLESSISSKQELENMILLLKDTKRFFNECLDYTYEQAKAGYLMIDFESVEDYCQGIIDAKEEGGILKAFYKRIEALRLPEEERYKEEVKEAYLTYFIGGYQDIMDRLEGLKSYKNNEQGLFYLEGGKEYYENLLKYDVGTSLSISKIHSSMKDILKESLYAIWDLYDAYPYLEDYEQSTSYHDYESIMKDLKEMIQEDFPTISDLNYTITPLEAELSNENTVAYFLVPKLDDTDSKTIRVNTTNVSYPIHSIDTFITLAHEGYPGHMYQKAYVYENIEDHYRKTFDVSGYDEGYATYIETKAYDYLKQLHIDEPYVDLHYYNSLFTSSLYILGSIGIHYEGWSVEDFNRFLVKEAYLALDDETVIEIYEQIRDALGAYENYYVGALEFNLLEDKARKALKEDFDEKEFHQAILKNGSVPFEIVSESVNQYIDKN